MSNLTVRFNRRKIEHSQAQTLQPLNHNLPTNHNHPIMQVKHKLSQQISNIDQEYLFKPFQSKAGSHHYNPNNPERPICQSTLQGFLKQQNLKQKRSVISTNSTSSTRRRSTFLTVVSRLPQCKRRSASLF